MFEIICRELTPERRRILAEREVITFNKPLRAVIAVGGAWIFYYGTNGEEPEGLKYMAILFTVLGIAAILFAIFSQKLIEMRYFHSEAKRGWFPESVSVGNGGVFVKHRSPKKAADTPRVTSVNAERFYAFAEVGGVGDTGDYFKMNLLRADAPGVYVFKEDFVKGDPEVFKTFIASKKQNQKSSEDQPRS